VNTYLRFILRHRGFVLCLLVFITCASGYAISKGVIASSAAKLFLGESEGYHRYLQRIKEFGNFEVIAIAFQDDDPLSPQSRKRLEDVVARIERQPGIGRVSSVLSAQRIWSQGETLFVESYADLVEKNPDRAGPLAKMLAEDPVYSGLLISPDGRHNVVVVELALDEDRAAESTPGLVNAVLESFRRAGFKTEDLFPVGFVTVMAEVMHQTINNFKRVFPLTLAVLLIAVFIMFRRLWPVAITSAVALTATAWTMGFAVLLDRQISILMAMAPIVILIVSFSDVIHLCSAYLLELEELDDKSEAINKSGVDVGRACLYTSMTTFVGFVSMSFVPTPVFRQMGLVLGFGVAVSLLIAMTLTPILFSYMKRPKAWRDGASVVQKGLDGSIRYLSGFAIGKPWIVVAAFTLLIALSVYGISQLHIETDLTKRLREDNIIRVSERYFNTHFPGANVLEVYIDLPDEGGVLDPEFFSAVSKFQDRVEALPGVHETISLVNLMEIIHREMNPASGLTLPDTRMELSQYLLFFEMSGGEDLNRLVDFERKTMRINVYTKGWGVRGSFEIGEKVSALAAEFFKAPAQVESTGIPYLIGQWLTELLAGQRRGILFAFTAIAIMMIIGLRSMRAGLWSMIPNAIPLLVLGGYVGLAWENVDSDTLLLAMMAIGIGVDDTIHFLMRLKIESERTGDMTESLKRTFHFSGRAIVITSIILCVGFAPCTISDYLSLRIMGTLMPLTLFVALFADLLLVPALASLGVIRFRKKD
jgi:uncharacterized protein